MITVSASAQIAAPPDVVYRLIADYHTGHPRIVPPEHFSDLVVEEGGYGEGTVIRYRMKVGGAWRTGRARVTEPEPGRVLVETNEDPRTETTFRVTPAGDGRLTHVEIETRMEPPGGPMGIVMRLMVPRMFRPIYAKELRLLAEAAAGSGTEQSV